MDEPDETPTIQDERAAFAKTYDDVRSLDSTANIDSETLRFHLKYYCEKNNTINVSAIYNPDKNDPRTYLTHPFAADIVLIRNADTVINKKYTAADFSPSRARGRVGERHEYAPLLPALHTRARGEL